MLGRNKDTAANLKRAVKATNTNLPKTAKATNANLTKAVNQAAKRGKPKS